LADAARMAGMSYNTAAVHLHRVKEKLRKQLIKEGVYV
jgi:DNA-directed RNA polymerase specialized sigma24 family protein